jgi:hypothetical protein
VPRAVCAIAGILLALCATSSPAAAQGNGHAYGRAKRGGGPSAAAAPELQLPGGTGVRNFGSWLDDASMIPAGSGLVMLSFGYWRTPSFSEWDVPVADASIGVTRRLQVGASVPYFHASEQAGTVARGFGDVYLSAKYQLREPSASRRRVGLSVTPVLEVLASPLPNAGRVSWALPVSAEWQGSRWRTFGSAGYFSRGSIFASGALEVAVGTRTHVTGTITQSHSVKRDDLSEALGFTQSRTDVTGAVSNTLSDTITIFSALGRTISARDPNSATIVFSAGAAFSFNAWQPRTRQPAR